MAGEVIHPGEHRDLQVKFSENYLGTSMHIPVSVIRSRKEGPIFFFTGAIHGDEINGVGILRELLLGTEFDLLKGTVVCVPVANVYGLDNYSRYLPDRRDLNRSFPGAANGSLTARLAHALYEEIIKKCDYGIDFHSAAVRRTNYPNVRADMRDAGVRTLARAFGCELIVDSRGPEGSLRRTACQDGIPTIILEAGEVWKIEPSVVEIGVRGSLNVLRSLGMISGKPEAPLFQANVDDTTWVRAERGGFLVFHARPGHLVTEGEIIATNYSIFGRERNFLTSPVSGIVLGVTTMPAVKPGEPVYNIARLAPKRFSQIRKRIEEASDQALFTRVRDDLATNITISERD